MVWLWRIGVGGGLLAVAAATVAACVLVVGGEADYLGPLYVLGIAAGAVAAEGWIAADPAPLAPWRWVRWPPAASCRWPLVAPVVPVDVYAELVPGPRRRAGRAGRLARDGRPGGRRRRGVLPAEEQVDVRVVTASSGEAAAIDLYGPARGLPRGTALSGHDSYADWWPDGEPPATFITVGYPAVRC